MRKLYYINATQMLKQKEVEQTRAVIASSLDELHKICTESYVTFNIPDNMPLHTLLSYSPDLYKSALYFKGVLANVNEASV